MATYDDEFDWNDYIKKLSGMKVAPVSNQPYPLTSSGFYQTETPLAGSRTGTNIIGKDWLGNVYGPSQPAASTPDTWREDLYRDTAALNRGGGGSYGNAGGYYADIPMPTLELSTPQYPKYTAPVRDQQREEFLQQKAAAPGISKLRAGLGAGITSTRSEDNPYLRKYYLGGMLKDYGEGLGEIKTKGDIIGKREYETEYGTKADEAKTQFATSTQQAVSDAAIANQSALAKYNLLAQMFAKQPLQKQAKSIYGSSGASRYNPPGGVLRSPYYA